MDKTVHKIFGQEVKHSNEISQYLFHALIGELYNAVRIILIRSMFFKILNKLSVP